MNWCRIIILGLAAAIMFSCAPQMYRFTGDEPVHYYNDIHPIPLPQDVFMDRFTYYANVIAPRPTVTSLLIAPNNRARDVNSHDQVPASSWYIPRLGSDDITPEMLGQGPTEFGPPQPPFALLKVRNPEENPRLFIRDRRDIYYLIKMDPKEFYGLATSSSLIVNRLFWGFGYNVPEDHLFYFNRKDINIDPEFNLSQAELDEILTRVAAPVNGQYRAIASRIIDGLPLGPAPGRGVRKQDPNDLFPHQERRILRALRVFAAFTNMTDIGSDNLFDIYVGKPGMGYVKHYLIDFDDALGTHASRSKHIWSGFNHIFSIKDILKNFFTFGLFVKDWEHIQPTSWTSVGTFEAEFFSPEDWKETHPFDPIQHSQCADNYWAAKILSKVTDEHLAHLVELADYPDPDAAAYILQTLIKRRDKVLNFYLNRVSPIEFVSITDQQLELYDVTQTVLQDNDQCTFNIKITDIRQKEISDERDLSCPDGKILIPFEKQWFEKSNDYFCVQVSKNNPGQMPPVQFHITLNNNDTPIVAGIVH